MLTAVWQYRGFVWGIVAREFRVRYLNSLLGSAWAVLNPLATILIYTVIFSQVMRTRLAGVDDTLAYSLYLCAGLLPWNYFAELIMRCQTVFLEHANLLKKVSFPRITLPIILLISSTVNFVIIAVVFLLFLVVAGRSPGWALLAFLPLLALQQGFALGFGIVLGTINVFYRDVGQLIGVVMQFWFWLTPIVYSVAIVPGWARSLFELNPMTAMVNAYQQIIISGQWPDWRQFAFQLAGAGGALVLAFLTFDRLAGEMLDEL